MSIRANEIWRDGWPERIRTRIQEMGYASPDAFASKFPTWSFEKLARYLGSNFAAVQMGNILAAEAEKNHSVTMFVKTSLIRTLHQHFVEAPSNVSDERFRYAHAIAAWKSNFRDEIQQKLSVPFCRLADNMDTIIQTRWLPESIDDPLIRSAFESINFDADFETN